MLSNNKFDLNRSLGFLCIVRQREILMTDLGLSLDTLPSIVGCFSRAISAAAAYRQKE